MGNQGLNFGNSTWPMNIMSLRRNNNDQNGEKEKEELKKRLSDLDLYEDGMSTYQMRIRLKFIDDSKNEASFSSTNNSGSPSDVIEALPSPTTTPVDNRMISNALTKTTSRELMNPEAIDSYRKQWPHPKDNDSSDEFIFGPSRPANTYAADTVRARKVGDESSNSRYTLSPSPNRDINVTRRNHSSQDMKTYVNSHRTSKSMDNFDVFDCKVLPNDVPLKQRCPPKPRQKIDVIDGIPVIPDEISAQKLAYLTEMSNLAHSWKAKLVCNEFSWGPPIKVGIANGSLDKFPIQEELPDDPEPPGQSCVIMREVNATSYSLRPTVKSTNFYDFDGDDDDFAEMTKRKKTPKILSNRSETQRQNQLKKSQNRDASGETSTNVISLLEVNDDKHEKTNSTANGRKRPKSASPEYPEEAPTYPRRVLPPIPSTGPKSRKKIVTATRTTKRNASPEYNTSDNKSKRTTSGLNDQEIEDLISEDEEPKIVDCALPPTKRLNQGVEYLKKAQLVMEGEKQKREKEAKLIAEQEAREKMERVQRRIAERDEKKQQEEAHEKSAKEREDRYRNLTSSTRSQGNFSGTFQKRTELESEELRPRTLHFPPNSREIEIRADPDVDDTDMFSDAEYETIGAAKAVKQPVCPICGKSFSQEEIEHHAANCDDFVQDKPLVDVSVSATPSNCSRLSALPTMFTCEICKFTNRDESLHKKHFLQCVRSLTEEGSKSMEGASSTRPSSKLVLSTHDSDVEIDHTESKLSPSTNKKKTPRPQSRKRKL